MVSTTADVPLGERFDWLRDGYEPVVELTHNKVSPAASFDATIHAFNLHGLVFGGFEYCTHEMRSLRRNGSGHGADALSLRLVEAGEITCLGHPEMGVMRLGDIGLYDMAEPIHLATGGCRVLTAMIPRAMIAAHAGLDQFRCGSVVRGDTDLGRILGHYVHVLWQKLPSATRSDIDLVNRMLLGSIAGAFAGDGLADGNADLVSQHADLEYVRAYIGRNLGDPSLGVDHLCRRFGYSRARLYRVFQPIGGVAGYIRQGRLERCRQELARGAGARLRIGDVGQRWGFESQSQFSRLFHKAFDMTPSDAVLRGGGSVAAEAPSEGKGDGYAPDLFAWMRELAGRDGTGNFVRHSNDPAASETLLKSAS